MTRLTCAVRGSPCARAAMTAAQGRARLRARLSQTAATSYQRRRQNACRDITDLIAQYTAHRKRRAEGEPAESQESKGAKLPSGAARGAPVDDLELSESEEYSSDEPSSDSSDA